MKCFIHSACLYKNKIYNIMSRLTLRIFCPTMSHRSRRLIIFFNLSCLTEYFTNSSYYYMELHKITVRVLKVWSIFTQRRTNIYVCNYVIIETLLASDLFFFFIENYKMFFRWTVLEQRICFIELLFDLETTRCRIIECNTI